MSQSVLREAKLSCSDQEGGRDAYFVSLLSDIVSEVLVRGEGKKKKKTSNWKRR